MVAAEQDRVNYGRASSSHRHRCCASQQRRLSEYSNDCGRHGNSVSLLASRSKSEYFKPLAFWVYHKPTGSFVSMTAGLLMRKPWFYAILYPDFDFGWFVESPPTDKRSDAWFHRRIDLSAFRRYHLDIFNVSSFDVKDDVCKWLVDYRFVEFVFLVDTEHSSPK